MYNYLLIASSMTALLVSNKLFRLLALRNISTRIKLGGKIIKFETIPTTT